jgi:hypothetical protein
MMDETLTTSASIFALTPIALITIGSVFGGRSLSQLNIDKSYPSVNSLGNSLFFWLSLHEPLGYLPATPSF